MGVSVSVCVCRETAGNEEIDGYLVGHRDCPKDQLVVTFSSSTQLLMGLLPFLHLLRNHGKSHFIFCTQGRHTMTTELTCIIRIRTGLRVKTVPQLESFRKRRCDLTFKLFILYLFKLRDEWFQK